MEAKFGVMQVLALKVENRAMSQEVSAGSRSWKRQRSIASLSLWKKTALLTP